MHFGQVCRVFLTRELWSLFPYSVIIDVNQLLEDRAREEEEIAESSPSMAPTKRSPTKVKREEFYVSIPPLSKNKRKATAAVATEPPAKKSRKSIKGPTITIPSGSQETKPYPKLSIKLKLPKPEVFPCCLCISMSNEGLLRVHDPPFGRKEALEACSNPAVWMAHEGCARIIPETWVDEVETASGEKEMVVFGVDGIVKDRWNLVRPIAHLDSLWNCLTFSSVYRNVQRVLGHGLNVMARQFSAPEANA